MEMDDQQRVEAMLVENLQRSDLAPIEEAAAYRRLVDEFGLSQRDLAARIGRSQGLISKRLSLLDLPKAAIAELDSGGITLDQAIELAKLKDTPERITTALTKARQGWRIDQAVREQLEDAKKQKIVLEETAKLKAAGVKVIKAVTKYGYDELPAGVIEIEKAGGYALLKLDPAQHASEKCHAVVVLATHGHVTLANVCTNRKNHPELKTESESRSHNYQRSEASKKHERELREARKTRFEFLRGVLAKPPAQTKDETLTLIVLALIRESWQDKRKLACEILGIDTQPYEKKNQAAGYGSDEYQAALADRASQRGKAAEVGLALHVASHENEIGKAWDGWKRHAPYFTWLDEQGYTIAPAERRELTGKTPR